MDVKKFGLMLAVLVLLSSSVILPVRAAEPTHQTIVDVASADGRFKTLVAAATAAGLADALQGPGPFTVFAPTDDAFAALPAGTVAALLKDIPALKNILLYHVVAGKLAAADVLKTPAASTLQGKPLKFAVMAGKPMANDANIVLTDIPASNGVIHVIDRVLIPPKDIAEVAAADGRFKTLVAAVQAAGWLDALKSSDPITVFAPTDDAFAKIPKDTLNSLLKDPAALRNILLYHVVSGKVMAADAMKLQSANTMLGAPLALKAADGKLMVNDATVAVADVPAVNGVIHAVDTVLMPPKMEMTGKSIAEVAAADGRFKTLVAALGAAKLADTLTSGGPFTVFAPTDEAFAKLPSGTVDALLKDIPKLTKILLYHVAAGKLNAAEVTRMGSLGTLAGQPVSINNAGGKVMINNSQVVVPDVAAANGVIHAIDSVLLPPQ